jgi:hypothetical protein
MWLGVLLLLLVGVCSSLSWLRPPRGSLHGAARQM